MTINKNRGNIRIGILGYGNLGRGVELAILQNSDMELVGIFTRRDPSSVTTALKTSPVYAANQAMAMKNEIDVMIICGGSATDLVAQSPQFARHFNIVDSFDTHAKIPGHFEAVQNAALEGGKLAIISVGWDPGLFSLNRLYAEAALPIGNTYTFWGDGVSQGHSDAIRRIPGVANAIQYTVPVKAALESVRSGKNPMLTAREKHTRLCYVVPGENADKERIREEIVNMPDYFSDYDTTVHFITADELARDHSKMPHGGFVLRSGTTGIPGANVKPCEGDGISQIYEFSLKLGSNPQFTSSVLTAYARAASRLWAEGATGARTVFDIPPSYLSTKTALQLRQELL